MGFWHKTDTTWHPERYDFKLMLTTFLSFNYLNISNKMSMLGINTMIPATRSQWLEINSHFTVFFTKFSETLTGPTFGYNTDAPSGEPSCVPEHHCFFAGASNLQVWETTQSQRVYFSTIETGMCNFLCLVSR
jgi:hypothetical protein